MVCLYTTRAANSIRGILMKFRVVFCLIAFFAFAGSGRAFASSVTYDFTVTATSGPLSGDVSSGSFSFDSSAIIPGGINTGTHLLTALDFTWDGISYNASTANTGALGFNSSGALDVFCFGNNSSSNDCEAVSGTGQWYVDDIQFVYTVPGDTYVLGFGTVTFGPEQATPEPGTLGLLATAVLSGAGLVRRRLRA